MALLSDIRRYSDSTVARLIFAAVVIVFVFWGVGSAGMGPQAQTLAHVNGKRIIDSDLQRLMRIYTRQNQGNMNESELRQLQSDVIDELIRQEAMLQEAERLKIEVSDKEISFQILQIEAFKGPDGKFSEELYERVLKSDGMSQAKFEEQLRQDLTLNKLRALVVDSIELPDAIAKARFAEIATEVEIRYTSISAQSFTKDVTITDEEVETELSENEADIKAQYDDDLTRLYQLPERYRIERIVKNIGEESDLDALKAELAGILSQVQTEDVEFGSLALLHSESPQPLSPLNATQLGPEAVAALELVENGGVTAIVETSAGLQIIKRLEKLAPQDFTFDEVKGDIARSRLKDKKSPEIAKTFSDEILKEWTSNQLPPIETLLANGISIQSPEAFPKGNSAVPGLSGNLEFEAALSNITEPRLIEQVFESNEAFFIVEVINLTPPTDEDFETIGRYYTAQMRQVQKQETLEAWTSDLLNRTDVNQVFFPLEQ